MNSPTRLFSILLLAAAPVAAQRLIALDSARRLYDVDMTSGAVRQFATIGSSVGTSGGLANDITTGTVYLSSTSLDSVYTLDIDTGVATLIGPYGNTALVMHGIEYDFTTGTLYGGSQGGIYTIDKVTGTATLVGSGSSLTSFTNLCFDYLTGTMYATESGSDSFYGVDLTAGTLTLIGPLVNATNPNGLAFDSDTNTIWMVDNTQDNLYTIDPATGVATVVGPVGNLNLLGLMYLPGPGNIRRIPNGCGAATIAAFGVPQIDESVDAELSGATGIPFMGMGLQLASTPICAQCSLGHEWFYVVFGTSVTLDVPNDPSFTGLQVGIQGADVGGVNGCTAPAVFTLTDTIVVTIG